MVVEGNLPSLCLVKSHRIRCAGCKTWVIRLPQWDGAFLGDKGWQCGKCLCTSIIIEEGRPFGPRCRHWQQLLEEFEELYPFWTGVDRDWFLSTVVIEDV